MDCVECGYNATVACVRVDGRALLPGIPQPAEPGVEGSLHPLLHLPRWRLWRQLLGPLHSDLLHRYSPFSFFFLFALFSPMSCGVGCGSWTGFWSNMFYDPSAIKTVTQTWPSIMWMLPLAQVPNSALRFSCGTLNADSCGCRSTATITCGSPRATRHKTTPPPTWHSCLSTLVGATPPSSTTSSRPTVPPTPSISPPAFVVFSPSPQMNDCRLAHV